MRKQTQSHVTAVIDLDTCSAGLPRRQLRLVSCADNERATPVAQDTLARRSNQRVELIVTRDAVPTDPYLHDPSSQ